MHTGDQGSERSPVSKVYWACQLAGWSTFLLFQLFALAVLNVDQSVPGPLVSSRASLYVAIALLSGSGLLVSHLLYLLMRRRGWLRMPLGRVWPRLLAAVALAAVVPSAIDIFLSHYLVHATSDLNLRPAASLITWLVFVFLFGVWVTIYLAVQEFRRRRIAEVHALRLELVAQEAQLRGLRAQLKPHFLFNCLNGLRELIVEDPQRAQSMVTRLSALLRYSLQSDHKEQVFLEEEIQAVRDYLALEAIRFEERLSVHWDIAPESSKVAVPPMLLQTLVENALKHGISRRPEGGEISIKALVRDSQLFLEVLNTGELPEQPSENGIGLRNARSRLHLLYGDQAKIVLENAPHGRARAVGTVPLQRKEAAPESLAGRR